LACREQSINPCQLLPLRSEADLQSVPVEEDCVEQTWNDQASQGQILALT